MTVTVIQDLIMTKEEEIDYTDLPWDYGICHWCGAFVEDCNCIGSLDMGSQIDEDRPF